MPRTKANGIELEHEAFGAPADPTLLLVSGFATQLIGWDVELCQAIAAEGFHVLRFDNRDVGLSSRIDAVVTIEELQAGTLAEAPYRLEDMADDAVGLLDALGVEAAHVVGMSMGGMVAQVLAIRHPDRVRSLCSIMSTTGDPAVGQPTADALATLLSPPATTVVEAAARGIRVRRAIGSPRWFDADRAARQAVEAFERAVDAAVPPASWRPS